MINIRRPYTRQHYVERETELQDVHEWLSGSKRLLTITAPPATGKTWFLGRVKEEFRKQGVVPLWIDVKEFLAPGQTPDASRPLSLDYISDWLQRFIARLKEQDCPKLSDYDPAVQTTLMLETIAREIGESCWPSKPVCLFVDDGDEFVAGHWRQFELTVLASFARQQSLRFVIALRDEQLVQLVPLRWSETRLRLGILEKQNRRGEHEGHEQLRKLGKNSPEIAARVNELLAALPDYEATHPGLNTFLYLLVEQNILIEITALRNIDYLKSALSSLNPQSRDDPQQIVGALLEIVEFADDWVVEELADWLSVSTANAWTRIQLLLDNGLVVNVDKNRYKVTDGVRGFVRALKRYEM